VELDLDVEVSGEGEEPQPPGQQGEHQNDQEHVEHGATLHPRSSYRTQTEGFPSRAMASWRGTEPGVVPLLLLQLLPAVLAVAAAATVHLRRQHHVMGLKGLAAIHAGERDEGMPPVLEEAPALVLGQGLPPLVLDLQGDAGGRTFEAAELPEGAEDLGEVLVGEAVEGRLELFLVYFHDLAPFEHEGWDRPPSTGGEQKPERGSWFEIPPVNWGTHPRVKTRRHLVSFFL